MSNSRGVVYKPFKSELDEGNVILFDEDSIKIEKRQQRCFFKTRQKSILVLCLGLLTFLILSAVIYFVIAHNSSEKCLFKKFVLSDRTNTCSPFESVKEIEIVLTQDLHNSCLDTFTCHLLIYETVQHYSNNNLSYTFLVSSDFKLILVFGYGCSTDSSLHNIVDLTISYIKNSRMSKRSSGTISLEDARTTMELIYQGIKCNGNQSNFTMTSLCVDGCNLSICGSIFEEEIIWLERFLPDNPYTSRSFKNLNWSVCANPVKDVS